jgi:hypothetical protein
MIGSRFRRGLLAVVAAGLVCSGIPVARAAGRTDTEAPVPLTGVVELFDCGGFVILDEFNLVFRIRNFYDKAGDFIRFVEQVSCTDTFVNSVTGTRLPSPFHNSTILDVRTGQVANHGVFYKAIVPGAGAVLLDVGNVVFDLDTGETVFRAGPHQAIDGDFAALCQALA